MRFGIARAPLRLAAQKAAVECLSRMQLKGRGPRIAGHVSAGRNPDFDSTERERILKVAKGACPTTAVGSLGGAGSVHMDGMGCHGAMLSAQG